MNDKIKAYANFISMQINEDSKHVSIDKHYDDWMSSEHAPHDDDSGDYDAVHTKASRFLDGRVPKHNIEDIADKLTNKFHGE